MKKDFSHKLKIIRHQLGFDQKKMSDILSLSQPTYSRMEKGSSDISSTSLDILFHDFSISPIWFFFDVEPMFCSIFNNNFEALSKFLTTYDVLFQVQQKIKTKGEKTFWENIFNSFEGAYELFSKALNNDFSEISMQNAKEILINKIEEVKLNKYGLGINTYNSDKQKLIEFIQSLEDVECFIILTNAPQIINTINSSRLILNRR